MIKLGWFGDMIASGVLIKTSILFLVSNFSAHIWLYGLPSNTFLQYLVWTSFPLILVSFSVGFTYLVSPHAIGK